MITQELVDKIDDLLKHGICQGVGLPEPGRMCVEAVICYAFGEPHGDKPKCVAPDLANFKTRLNDWYVSDPVERAQVLRDFAIAQLGTKDMEGIVGRLIARAREELGVKENTCVIKNCFCSFEYTANKNIKKLCDAFVKALIIEGSPGSMFVDRTKYGL
jgi:hypothetical protein